MEFSSTVGIGFGITNFISWQRITPGWVLGMESREHGTCGYAKQRNVAQFYTGLIWFDVAGRDYVFPT